MLKMEKVKRIINDSQFEFYLFTSDNGRSMALFKNGRTLFFDSDITKFILAKESGVSKELDRKLRRVGMIDDVEISDIMPAFFMIDFTTRCNMNCYYCLRNFEDEGYIISDDALKEIVDWISDYCIDNKIEHIFVQPWGGEPLLAVDKIINMRNQFIERRVNTTISVQTNGLLLDEPMAQRLRDNNINIGISIDGCETIHNKHRKDMGGNDTFERVNNAIKVAQNVCDSDIGTITVNSKFSLEYLSESIESMVKSLGLHTIKFNLMHPNSECFDMNSAITNDEIEQYINDIFSKIIALNEEGYRITDSNIRDKIMNVLIGGSGDICHSRGCMGGRRFVTIAQNGDIYPCELVGNENVKIGNIHSGKKLQKMIEDSIINNEYFNEKREEQCEDCPWHVYCKGGCTASILSYKGKVEGIDEKECNINKVLYPLIIELILEKTEIVSKLTKGKASVVFRDE